MLGQCYWGSSHLSGSLFFQTLLGTSSPGENQRCCTNPVLMSQGFIRAYYCRIALGITVVFLQVHIMIPIPLCLPLLRPCVSLIPFLLSSDSPLLLSDRFSPFYTLGRICALVSESGLFCLM